MKTSFEDKPSLFPTTQVNGAPLKPITQVLLDRRATAHFKSDPVPDEYLQAILQFTAQAPSGYNLQPWRFIVVREEKNRRRLQKAAANQPKVGEAPVVVIAFAVKGEWKNHMDGIFKEGVRRGSGKAEEVEKVEKNASAFLEHFPPAVWLNLHTMMLVAEAYGLDTAPMEGFDAEAVKYEFGLPAAAEVVALLAIGFAKEPDKAYPGRLALKEFVHEEHYKADLSTITFERDLNCLEGAKLHEPIRTPIEKEGRRGCRGL
jgi:nitroreductase